MSYSFMDFSYVTTECWHGRWLKGRSLGIFMFAVYCRIWLLGHYLYDNNTALEYESVLIASWRRNMFPHYYTFVRLSHRSPMNFPHQWPVMRGLSSLFFILYNLENEQSNSLCSWNHDAHIIYIWRHSVFAAITLTTHLLFLPAK